MHVRPMVTAFAAAGDLRRPSFRRIVAVETGERDFFRNAQAHVQQSAIAPRTMDWTDTTRAVGRCLLDMMSCTAQ